MRISELLISIASWLESPDNEALLLAEYDDDCLQVVAESCVKAAYELKKAANTVDQIEPPEESLLNAEAIDDIAQLAAALDESGDPDLIKQASVLDELLLTIAAPPYAFSEKKAMEDFRVEEIKKKYLNTKTNLDEKNKVADSVDAINDSNMTKEYNILEAPLSTRHCPDHPGAQMARISEHRWQCNLDKKIYDFEQGYTLNNGSKVPGGSVENQSDVMYSMDNSIFDTREERLNQ